MTHYRVVMIAIHKQTNVCYESVFVTFANSAEDAIANVNDFYDYSGMDIQTVKAERCHPSAYFIYMKPVD
jgi:hypothetical protein